jgi:hypothetical protein
MELAGTWPGKTTLYEIQFLGKIRLELSFAEKDPTSSILVGVGRLLLLMMFDL